jgi:small-conductance mechanosensitive channel
VKSELTLGMNAALRDAGISIPFPQRDLYIKSVAPESVTSRTAEAKTPTLSAHTGQETANETEK